MLLEQYSAVIRSYLEQQPGCLMADELDGLAGTSEAFIKSMDPPRAKAQQPS